MNSSNVNLLNKITAQWISATVCLMMISAFWRESFTFWGEILYFIGFVFLYKIGWATKSLLGQHVWGKFKRYFRKNFAFILTVLLLAPFHSELKCTFNYYSLHIAWQIHNNNVLHSPVIGIDANSNCKKCAQGIFSKTVIFTLQSRF